MKRIDLLQLFRRQHLRSAVIGFKGDDALSHRIGGHLAKLARGARIQPLLEVSKKENTVADNVASQRSAELVADELLARNTGAVAEPVVRGRCRIAVVLVRRTVERVGAALGDERDLTAGTAALIRIPRRSASATAT